MIGIFYDVHDVLYHHAKFGEIDQRAPTVGKYGVFVTLSRQCIDLDAVLDLLYDALIGSFSFVGSWRHKKLS